MIDPEDQNELYALDMEQEFEIDKKISRRDVYSLVNVEKRAWFFENYSRETRLKVQEEYYQFLNKNKFQVIFLTWFELFAEQQINYPFANLDAKNKMKKRQLLRGKLFTLSILP